MLSLFMLFTFDVAVRAMDHGAIRCAKVLLSHHEHQRKVDPTGEVLARLSGLRANAPTEVMARIDEVLGDANDPRVHLTAFELNRLEEVRGEIERRRESGRHLHRQFRKRIALHRLHTFVVAGSASAATATLLATTLLTLDPWFAAVSVLGLPVRHLPERFARGVQFFFGRNTEEHLDRALVRGDQVMLVASARYLVARQAARRILERGDVSEADLTEFFEAVTSPEWTMRATSNVATIMGPALPPEEKGLMQLDEFLVIDAVGKPHLISALRLSL